MLAIFFVLGLIIGSFLNVLVYRLQVAETILGRSHCPKCKKPIRWYDNIPLLSFVILNFRCRDCRAKISLQYPLVEFFTGALFAAIGYYFFDPADAQSWLVTAYYLVVIGALISIFVYDFLYLEIPGLILWPVIALALVFNAYMDWEKFGNLSTPWDSHTLSGILAAALAFAFFFALVFFSREKWMGIGDAYLAILLGLFLGWPKIILAIFLAFSVGAIYGIITIVLKQKTLKSQVPFAPFLVAGTLIAVFFYSEIINWYFGLFY